MAVIYVPDNYPYIQTAINNATPGDTVLVRPGTYTEPESPGATPMITINKSITLQSTDGAAVTILNGNSATDRYYMVSIEADNVTFDGFTVENPLYTGSADASGILTSLDGGGHTGLRITNNVVHDIGSMLRPNASFGTFGVNIGPVDGLEVGNNVVYNIGNNDGSSPGNGWAVAIFVYGNDPSHVANNVTIHDNTIYNIVSPNLVNDGVTMGSDSQNVVVANNNIHASGLKRGVVTNPAMTGLATITGNTIDEASSYGILLRSPYAQIVTYNTITRCGIGIQINATVTTTPEIHYNNIYNNVDYGLVNLATVPVNAQDNWWGTATGPNTPGGDRVQGLTPAEYTPVLQQPVGATIAPLVRMYSSGGSSGMTYVSELSREDAIAAAIGAPTTAAKSTVVTGIDTDIAKRAWDRIAGYTNSTIFSGLTVPGGLATPQFVWDATTSPGQTRYFAMGVEFTLDTAKSGVFVAITNFADNAHDYQVGLYDATSKALITTSPVLQDGNVTTPVIGVTEQPPYNWQTVRLDSQLLATPLAAGTPYYLVVSHRVLNYLIFEGGLDPAGLMFIADTWTVA
ncbi:right-handed parallel beta-helix repeat-containing protein [Alicyclobacillus curvatus]|nr:right-handed parallel beta-helix repeat-containing protein [Alicyclobacillus curvatus]